MPFLVLFALIVVAVVALIPIAFVQRYRAGTSRQRARGWVAAINLAGLTLSALLVLATAAFTNIWVPDALTTTLAGLAAGGLLGVLGLRLTRWERSPGSLHYTPNAMLVLALTLVVGARVVYSFWRGWHTWRAGLEGGAWVVQTGVAGSMAAGAVVLGYYLVYWLGVRRRIRRHLSSIRRL